MSNFFRRLCANSGRYARSIHVIKSHGILQHKSAKYLLAGAGASVISGVSFAYMKGNESWFHKPWTSYQSEILLPDLVFEQIVRVFTVSSLK